MKKFALLTIFALITSPIFAGGAIFHFDIGFSSAHTDHNGRDFNGDTICWGVGMTANTASADENKKFAIGFGSSAYVSTNLIPEKLDEKDNFLFIDGHIMTGPGFIAAPWKGGNIGLNAGPVFALSLGHQFCTLGIAGDLYITQKMGESGIAMAFGTYTAWTPVSIFSQHNDSSRIALMAYFGLSF